MVIRFTPNTMYNRQEEGTTQNMYIYLIEVYLLKYYFESHLIYE